MDWRSRRSEADGATTIGDLVKELSCHVLLPSTTTTIAIKCREHVVGWMHGPMYVRIITLETDVEEKLCHVKSSAHKLHQQYRHDVTAALASIVVIAVVLTRD